MKIIWSLFAFKMLKDIYTYHKKAAGKLVASKIKNEIFSNVCQLGEHQKIGHTDPILENLGEGHRYFVTGNYKIVYKKVKKKEF